MNRILHRAAWHKTLRSYAGLKLLAATALFIALSIGATLLYNNVLSASFHAGTAEQLLNATRFAGYYWASHLVFAILLLLLAALVFEGDALEPLLGLVVETPAPDATTRTLERRLQVSIRAIVTLDVALLFIAWPLLVLHFGFGPASALATLPAAASVAAYIRLAGLTPPQQERIRPIAKHRFAHRSYNVAGMSVASTESLSEVRIYRELSASGGANEDVMRYVAGGLDSTLWRGNSSFLQLLGQFMGTAAPNLRLFHATTDAIEHALREALTLPQNARRRRRILLCSDADYPAITQRVTSLSAQARLEVVSARVCEHLWAGAEDRQVLDAYVTAADSCKDAIDILLLTHVHNETGRPLPLRDIIGVLTHSKKLDPDRSVIAIDGAQALGNIVVDESILSTCTFYAGCGHKWLLGEPSLGILYTNPARHERLTTLQNTRGLSHYEPVAGEDKLGTINLAGHISLHASLIDLTSVGIAHIASHNTQLAIRFIENIRRLALPFHPLPHKGGGIVTVTSPDDNLVPRVASRLARRGKSITPYAAPAALRFSFHYYHGEEDVAELIEALYTTLEELQ